MSSNGASRQLIDRFQKADRLPSPPGVALRIVELCRREDSTARELTDVLSTDATLTARLLKYANSPISGIGRKITSPAQAVQYIGFRTVQIIALGFALPTSRGVMQCKAFNLKRFWTECFITGALAKQLANRTKACPPEDAFTAGLLSNFGRLALAQGLPKEYDDILSSHAAGAPLIDVERASLNTDHIEIGVELLRLWRLPARLISMLEFGAQPETAPEALRPATLAINAARTLAPLFCSDVVMRDSDLPRARLEALAINAEAWEAIATTVVNEYAQLRDILEMDLDDNVTALDIFTQAHRESTRLAMTQQVESTKMAQSQVDLLRKASTDQLTQLANRARFDEILEEITRDARRGHNEYALLLIDIDHFKTINDTFGHTAGDRALTMLAAALKNSLRDTDMVARYGGDEFAIILRHIDRATACMIAQRTVDQVNANPLTWLSNKIPMTVSVGVAYGADFAAPPQPSQVIAMADEQLYASKHRGRNTWTCRAKAA